MLFSKYRSIKSSVLFILFTCLVFVSNVALAQGSIRFGAGVAKYSIKTRKGLVSAQASVAKIENWDPNFETPPLSLQIWLSTKKYKLGKSARVLVVGKRSIGAMDAYTYFADVGVSSNGARRVKSGKYYVTLALVDEAETQIFDAISFKKTIKVP